MTTTRRAGRPAHDPGQDWHGEQLRLRRAQKKMTLEDLCIALGERGYTAGLSTVARYERSERTPPKAFIQTVAKIFGCRPRDFSNKPKIT